MTEIRLACMNCDREDFDGTGTVQDALDAGWEAVDEADVSIAAYGGAWWTHLGWCPSCVASGAMK